MSGPTPKDGVLDMPAYVGGKETVDGVKNPFKLSANENPLGAGVKAQAALSDFGSDTGDLSLYPDGGARALREKLAALNNIDAARIVCGNGSDDILSLLAQAYLGPGDEMVHTAHAFLIYKLAGRATGATPVEVAEQDLTANVDAILAAISDKTKIVFLANPNNPTGTMLDKDAVARLHKSLPDSVLLVLDGAYAEYVDPDIYPAAFDMVDAHDNVVTTRTFSKAYGLAALRLGWGYCPPQIADALNRLRGPFNINSAALHVGMAALDDQAHIEKSRAHNAQWRDWLVQQIGGLGIGVRSTQANFILLEFGDADEAARAEAAMCAAGVIPRGLAAYGLPTRLRLSIGTQDANRAALAALESFNDGDDA
ncbi:MAG: histidinol-phosphate transaminase [Alphaproteobacteria bacterium]|nr:histidinol-phosphate transaminase [Alphaproteobacteria bacterium]